MSFTSDINRHTRRYEADALLIVRRSWLQLVREVVLGTPVLSGRARGSWQAGFNAPPTGSVVSRDKSGGVTVGKLTAAFAAMSTGIWWLASNLPYIRRLEYGWSKQAPAGMVRIAAARYTLNVNRAAAALRR